MVVGGKKHPYVECTKVTTNNWNIRPSVIAKALFANISWTAEWIHMIKLALENTHQWFLIIYDISYEDQCS